MIQIRAEVAVKDLVDAVNAMLKHDAIVFRIQPDDEHGYAVRRLPSEAMETHVIEPALTLLRENSISEALTHYEQALHHFARGGYDSVDAIVQASHAVESTMKEILRDRVGDDSCDAMNANRLIARIQEIGLLPATYQAQWNHLAGLLQSAPTIRNR